VAGGKITRRNTIGVGKSMGVMEGREGWYMGLSNLGAKIYI
jgi:hypothetical protein